MYKRQNQNNNFSAIVPYDMELQRKESKEFLSDLTTRDQRMMQAVLTLVITADTKQQLDTDTEKIRSLSGRCQLAVLKYQQIDGLNTVLPIGTRKINAFRTLTTESLAVFMPFKVQEIMEMCIRDSPYHRLMMQSYPNTGGRPQKPAPKGGALRVG